MKSNICPNGYICINHFNVVIIIIVILTIIYVLNNQYYKNLVLNNERLRLNNFENHSQSKPEIHTQQNTEKENKHIHKSPEPHQHFSVPPHRHHDTEIEERLNRFSINEETRPSSGDFQQVGILSKNDINDDSQTSGNNTDTVVLPLYGKQTYRGSNKWLYYTETDKFKPIKVPIKFKNKDCLDDTGCDEIMNNDNITLDTHNGIFKVKIYKFNKPRYIPYL